MANVSLVIQPDPDEPDAAAILVDGTIAGRAYRFILDTGSARTQVEADAYTAALNPIAADTSSGTFASKTYPIVTITDLAVGPISAVTLDVARAEPIPPHVRTLLGMDVLQRHRCHFKFSDRVLEVDGPAAGPEHDLQTDNRGHIYLDVRWAGVTAHACWDTGAEVTVVNQAFWDSHPELFERTGATIGTDATGTQAENPTVTVTEYEIASRRFARHSAVAVDLTHANSTVEQPMDLILGYPTLRQADWLFDFPAGRWSFTD